MQDECSFVSLRDVERTLLIFIYFYETFTTSFKVSTEEYLFTLILNIGDWL